MEFFYDLLPLILYIFFVFCPLVCLIGWALDLKHEVERKE